MERMLGSFSPEGLDPVEESTSAIMDSVEDYCRVRRNNPFFRRSRTPEKWQVVKCKNLDNSIGYKLERNGKMTVGGCHFKTRREADEAARALNSGFPMRNPLWKKTMTKVRFPAPQGAAFSGEKM